MSKRRIVVGLMDVASVYGGPEEGGWYYDAGSPTGRYWSFFNLQKAQDFRDKLQDSIEKGAQYGGTSMGGCGDDADSTVGDVSQSGLRAELQFQPKGGLQGYPDVRPHYE